MIGTEAGRSNRSNSVGQGDEFIYKGECSLPMTLEIYAPMTKINVYHMGVRFGVMMAKFQRKNLSSQIQNQNVCQRNFEGLLHKKHAGVPGNPWGLSLSTPISGAFEGPAVTGL